MFSFCVLLQSRQFELEVTNNKLEEENNQLKKDLDPNTNRVAELQKNNNQLMRELESVKVSEYSGIITWVNIMLIAQSTYWSHIQYNPIVIKQGLSNLISYDK